MDQANKNEATAKWMKSPLLAVFIGLVVGSIIVIPALRAWLWAGLPYLILLLCPFVHLFLHKHHGGDSGHNHGTWGKKS